jgi:hypothetical protein
MKISGETLQTLASFSQINSNISLHKGNIQNIASNGNAIFGRAVLEDNFPMDCGFYEAEHLLKILTFDTNPELEFQEECLKANYSDLELFAYYSPKEFFRVKKPEFTIALEKTFHSFGLPKRLQDALRKYTKGNLAKGNRWLIIFEGRNGRATINITQSDLQNEDGYQKLLSADIGNSNHEFKVALDAGFLKKILTTDYEACLDGKGFCYLKAKDRELEYWLAAEAHQQYPEL